MERDVVDDEALERVVKSLSEVAKRLHALEDRLDGIDTRLDDLDTRTAGSTGAQPAAARGEDWAPLRHTEPPVPAPAPRAPPFEPTRTPAPAPSPSGPTPGAAPPAATEPATEPGVAHPKRDLEALVGGNLLAKAGIAILVVGVVFLFRLTFDQGWVGPRGRIALGIVGGLALAVMGDLLWRRGRTGRLYPQILAGGGIAIAYFTVYAAYAFGEYREILNLTIHAPSISLGLLAAALAAYAYWREAPVLAGQAVLLGGVAILFGGTWVTFAIAYAVLLAVGVSAVAAVHSWRRVAYMALLSPAVALLAPALARDVPIVWVVAAAVFISLVAVAVALMREWNGLAYTGVAVAHGFVWLLARFADAGLPSLALIGAFFVAVLLGATRRRAATVGYAATGAMLLTLPTFVEPRLHLPVSAWAMLITLVALLGLGAGAFRRWRLMGVLVVIAAQLPLVAVVIQESATLAEFPLQGLWVVAALVALGAAVAAFAWYLDHQATTYAAAAAFMATGALFGLDLGVTEMQRLFTGMLVALALVVASTTRAWVYGGAAAAALATWSVHMTVESGLWSLAAAAVLPLFAVPVAARVRMFDAAERRALAMLAGLTLLAGALLALRVESLLEHAAWRGPTVAAFAVVGLVAATLWRGAAREARMGWGAAGLVLAAAWPPVQFDGSATAVSWTLMLALSVGVMWQRPRPWVQVVVLAFAALATGHVWYLELARIHDGDMAFASGLFVVGLLTLALVSAWAALAARPVAPGQMAGREAARWNQAVRELPLAAGVLLPVLYLGTLLEGVLISLAWAAEAALFVAAGFVVRQKELRLAGLAVFALVVVRIAFVDIRSFELVYRVITFIGVGVLLLAIAFLYARRKRPVSDHVVVPET